MTAAKKVLDKITSYSSVVIFIAMVLMVTYQVIARYFFKSPSSVTEVLTRSDTSSTERSSQHTQHICSDRESILIYRLLRISYLKHLR